MIQAQVEEFFKFFFGRPLKLADGSMDLLVRREMHYGGWFDENTGAPVKGSGAVPIPLDTGIGGKLDTVWQNHGACGYPVSLHICLNTTDLKGRKTENIKSCNVICLDLDREIEREEVRALREKYDVGLIVESSPRKYHFYWRVSNSIPLDRWSNYQLAFASKFNGDKALRGVTSMIRVPGFSRITKKGEQFMPSVIYRAAWGDCRALDEGALLMKFPWIPGEIEKGEKLLEKDRARMSLQARKQWREFEKLGKGSLRKIDAGEGRNNYLYWAVKKQVIETTRGQQEIMEFGAEVNKAFGDPLGRDEAISCVLSGWKHGLKVRRKRERRELSLLEDLPMKPEQELNGHADIAERARRKSVSSEINKTAKILDKQSNKSANKGELKNKKTPKVEIPVSFRNAAAKMADSVWRRDRKLCSKRLFNSIKTKHFQGFAEWFCSEWSTVGAIRASGPAVFLKDVSKWGSPVGYATPIPKEMMLGFVSAFVHEIWKLYALKYPNKTKTDKGKPKIPTQAAMLGLGDAVWKCMTLQPCTARQSSDIVVFQNGVFNLNEKTFEAGTNAPVLFSHALWATFCDKTEALYRSVRSRAANEDMGAEDTVRELLSTCCPRFYSYLENWFPGDMLTAVSILRYFGYCCTTDFGQHKFAFFYGPTRAGKGSLCRILCGIVGDNNYASMDYSALDGGFSYSGMHDKLVVSIEEVEATPRQSNSRMSVIKKLTGGERVTFERKYQDPFEDYVVGKLILQSNEAITCQDSGHSIRSRMLVYGFEQTFEENPGPDPAKVVFGNLENTEAPAIATLAALFWAEAKYKPHPFRIEGSRALKVGTDQIISGIDIIATVIKKYFVPDPKGSVTMDTFHKAILYVAESRGIKLPEVLPRKIAQLTPIIMKELPQAKPSKKTGEKHTSRGFLRVKFLQEQYLKDYPDADTTFENEF